MSNGQDITYVDVTIAASTMVLTAMAQGIFLDGQTIAFDAASTKPVAGGSGTRGTPTDSTSTSTPSGNGGNGSLQQDPSEKSTSNGQSSGPIAGPVFSAIVASAIVGGIMAIVGLLFLLVFWHKKNRQKQDRANIQTENVEGHFVHNYLHGSGKGELDASASATRNELEGSLGEDRNRGAGIYVRKPELEGSPGAGGAVYVLSKAELEARQRIEIAELEAIAALRPRDG